MSASYTDLYIHLVWATFPRAPMIVEALERPLFATMADKCRELRCRALAIGGMPDHVHLLVSLSPAVAVARLAKEIKGASAHLITHRLAPDSRFQWQSGYGAFSLRKDDVPVVRRYVLDQKDHHARLALRSEWEQVDGNES